MEKIKWVHYPEKAGTNLGFHITETDTGWSINRTDAQLIVLMDIRAELQKLNLLLGCRNFTGIPSTLRSIQRELATQRKNAAKAAAAAQEGRKP